MATSSLLRLRKHPPLGVNEDRVFWRWRGAPESEPLRDPTGDARYQLCVYGGPTGAVIMDVGTPQATTCPAANAACWRRSGAQRRLQDCAIVRRAGPAQRR